MASPMDGKDTRDVMLSLLKTLSIDCEKRHVRRVTLTLDVEEGATVYVEEYPESGQRYVDLKAGVEGWLPALSPKVVNGPPPLREA